MKGVIPLHFHPTPEGIVAFSTTRHGGCGQGAYGTFNCTPYTGDNATVVHVHQEQLCRILTIPNDRLIIPYQTHDHQVLTIDDVFMSLSIDDRHALLQGKDALISNIPGVCLCVSTADCIPILLFDHFHQAIAAIHAGWRGTAERIVTHTFHAMHEKYGTTAEQLCTIIGPGISLDAFEVGNEVYNVFCQAGFSMEQISCWHSDKGKYHIDLPAANKQQLLDLGVPKEQIHDSGICTYTNYHDYFSARRLGIKSGRILNGIILSDSNKQLLNK